MTERSIEASVPSFKRHTGWRRLWRACGHSWAGLREAVRVEAAFRQELAIGLPALVAAWALAPGRLEALALTASVALVWIVELLNSALEAAADAVTTQPHPLIKRAKDMASAAVTLTLLLAALTWAVVFWP